MENEKIPQTLIDRNGAKINEDDVIYNGEHYFRVYWNEKTATD